ncbi:MAG: hypothetical protein GC134_02585 [Proteobacteria bacterium]|nr:hypothetical protein [Pseudomonadota bacterium]
MPVRVLPPRGDKNAMFEFVGRSKLEVMAYNSAIQTVMADYNDERRQAGKTKHTVFHQVGVTHEGDKQPGYHAWEIWGGDVAKMESQIPAIEAQVREERETARQFYSSDKEYWADMTAEPKLHPIEDRLYTEIEQDCQRLCAAPTPEQSPER